MNKSDVQVMIDELKGDWQWLMPEDLDNQIPSDDPAQRVRQLAWQAQKEERRITNS
jgi:hypothetical protein